MSQKTILVTGGAGFVGSHLCKRLVKEGHRVISLDNYFSGSKDNHVPGVEYREGHTKDIARHVPEDLDIIYHLGEYSRVEQSVLEPEIVHDLNTLGTTGVLEFWRERKCKLLYAGSSTKFGDDGRTRHTSPYASTKAENTERVKKLGDEHNIPYAITYFYNVYGPGERAGIYGTVIEAFKQMCLQGAPLAIVSPGTQKRNFTHVEDIVDGLVLVGEHGQGDEYGLGSETAFSILEVARLFSKNIVLLPERGANRTHSALDTSKTTALGWRAKRSLEEYIASSVGHDTAPALERRVLVFSTTFFPVMGPAEEALHELIRLVPDVQFDIITTSFSSSGSANDLPNAKVYPVGIGQSVDKYLLPWLGYWKAKKLSKKHSYLFAWALMASYGGLSGLFLKWRRGIPFLITLADQDMRKGSFITRIVLKGIMGGADQVYGIDAAQEQHAASLLQGKPLRKSLGVGDAFANQLRYSYAQILLTR